MSLFTCFLIPTAQKTINPGTGKTRKSNIKRKIKSAFHAHLEETHGQIERIDQVVNLNRI